MTQYAVTISTVGGNEYAFSDSVIAGQGTIANSQILGGHDVKAKVSIEGGEGFVVIPYSSIGSAVISTRVVADSEVTDSVCNETNA